MPDPFARSQAPSFAAPVTPPGLESEVTFISGVTSDATVAATSFGAWTAFEPYPSIPAQYNPYYSNTTKWGDPTLLLAGTPAVVTYQFDPDRTGQRTRRKAPGARLSRCGRQKSRSRSRPRRQEQLPISPSISSRFPVILTPRPAHSRAFPTPRPRSSAATSRAFPGRAPSSRSISRASANPQGDTQPLGDDFRRQQRFLLRSDP